MLYFYNKVITSSVIIEGLNMDMILMLGSPVVTALMMMTSNNLRTFNNFTDKVNLMVNLIKLAVDLLDKNRLG